MKLEDLQEIAELLRLHVIFLTEIQDNPGGFIAPVARRALDETDKRLMAFKLTAS